MPGRRAHRHLIVRIVIAAGLSIGVLSACGDQSTTTRTTLDARESAETLSTNPFIPEDVNIGDCVSSLPRPGCGNEIRGDSHAAMTFGVLVLGLTFIGWRIVRSVRRRDGGPGTAVAPPTTRSSSPAPSAPSAPSDDPAAAPPTDLT